VGGDAGDLAGVVALCGMTGVSLPILDVFGGSGTVSRGAELFLEKVASRNNISTRDVAYDSPQWRLACRNFGRGLRELDI